MFMVRVYNEDGNRMWLDNGYIWDNIETLKLRLREEMENEKKILGASKKTYTVIPISFEESNMCVDMPMLDKEVEINDIKFADGADGFKVHGKKEIASFLYAWVEKQAEKKGYSRESIEKSEEELTEDGDITIIVKERKSIGA